MVAFPARPSSPRLCWKGTDAAVQHQLMLWKRKDLKATWQWRSLGYKQNSAPASTYSEKHSLSISLPFIGGLDGGLGVEPHSRLKLSQTWHTGC